MDLEKIISNPFVWLLGAGGLVSVFVFIVLVAMLVSSPAQENKDTAVPTIIPTVAPTTQPTVIPTLEPTPEVTPEPVLEVIPEFAATPTPAATPWPYGSEYWHVPTQIPAPAKDRTIDVYTVFDNPFYLGRSHTFKIFVGTHDEPLHDVLIRLNVSYMNKQHELEGLGYLPLDSSKAFSLPANSKTTKDYSMTLMRDGIILPDGTKYSVPVYATVYQVKVDLISGYDGKIIGSNFINRLEVQSVDSYGYASFDW